MNITSHVQRVKFLYKTILKLHRGLPLEIQPLGNDYVRDEFRRHKNCNPAEAQVFMTEWADYATKLAEQLGLRGPQQAKKLGIDLDQEAIEKMRDEQIQQLYELMMTATGKHDEKSEDT
ncbi:succinate dehydrogenase assembly factor 3, mitochondrial [Diprion similis]|uniref:succinate dehydrogenase assembly factor 3, mitochondrial n=1 Tax=Diprion similis TaxID=362088 RepID=UPI001EF8FEDD|nr:succinate dehydrogenase assembly factor 3, mitochondrial [Diprion similis]XP_046742108.1 succinate dehydrogenase assembly factor 3, mitochondrial [Diprion similis]XP_046742110.1 succinate dehydrogenase assembly factor 3, mitochondrial [Diprion similis]